MLGRKRYKIYYQIVDYQIGGGIGPICPICNLHPTSEYGNHRYCCDTCRRTGGSSHSSRRPHTQFLANIAIDNRRVVRGNPISLSDTGNPSNVVSLLWDMFKVCNSIKLLRGDIVVI